MSAYTREAERRAERLQKGIEIGAGVATAIGLGVFYYYLYKMTQIP